MHRGLAARRWMGLSQLKLTREGLLQPWVRLRDTESAEKERMRRHAALFDTEPGWGCEAGGVAISDCHGGW